MITGYCFGKDKGPISYPHGNTIILLSMTARKPDFKLILVEGFPGTGKSTTTQHIGSFIQRQGITCRWFLEEDDPHPIACLDFKIEGLPENMIPLWTDFVQQAMQEPAVTIIESRLWQNTALFMYMSNWATCDIRRFGLDVAQAIAPLSPILIHLDQEDTETAVRRLYNLRGEKWIQEALAMTATYPWFQSRALKDFAGWVQFFTEWQVVAESLYDDWPHRKLKIKNPHDGWAKAIRTIDSFLESSFLHAR